MVVSASLVRERHGTQRHECKECGKSLHVAFNQGAALVFDLCETRQARNRWMVTRGYLGDCGGLGSRENDMTRIKAHLDDTTAWVGVLGEEGATLWSQQTLRKQCQLTSRTQLDKLTLPRQEWAL